MKIIAVIQARMNSVRLPGKVLLEVKGKVLLDYLLENVEKCKTLDGLLVATSSEPSDDPIAEHCRQCAIPYFRGSLNDVAKRFIGAIQNYQLDAFVRISADSPLIDPALIDQAVNIFRRGDYDIVTNVFKRCYPKGQSVEVVRSRVLIQNYPHFSSSDVEHVTPYFYRHPEKFKIFQIEKPGENLSKINLCVDDPSSLEAFQSLVDQMDRPHTDYGWEALMRFKPGVSAH